MKNMGASYNGGPDYYLTDPAPQEYGQLIVDRQGMLEGLIG